MSLTLISALKEQRQSAIHLRCAMRPQASTPGWSRGTTKAGCPTAKRRATRHIDGIAPSKDAVHNCAVLQPERRIWRVTNN